MAERYSFRADRGVWGWLKSKEISMLMTKMKALNRPLKILDLGCGPGIYARRLHRELPDTSIVGVDQSVAMIREFQKFGFEGYCGDIETMRLPADSFDVVLLFGVLEFVRDLEATSSAIKRCSSNKTKIFVLVPRVNLINIFYYLYHRFHGNKILLRTRKNYIRAFEKHDFKLVDELTPTPVSRIFIFQCNQAEGRA